MKKHNKKTFKSFLKKNAVKIWIAAVILSLTGLIVYAAYPNKQNVLKRVIATSADKNIRFSSNYLEEGNVVKFKTVLNPNNDPISVYVRNYTKNNDGLRYSKDISYEFSVTLTDNTGIMPGDDNYAEHIAAVLAENENLTVTFGNTTLTLNRANTGGSLNSTLSKETSSQDEFRVLFPSASSKICLCLTATPSSAASYPDLSPISAILSVSAREASSENGWTGSFNDSRINKSPASYDAFNYTLTGHGESSSATFSWDSSKVEVNRQYFLSNFNADVSQATTEGSWKTITIHIGTNDATRYDFQIFKTGGTISDWPDLDNAVNFDDGIE